jgi:hypothetical protein
MHGELSPLDYKDYNSRLLRRLLSCGTDIVGAQTVWGRPELSHQTTLIDSSALRSTRAQLHDHVSNLRAVRTCPEADDTGRIRHIPPSPDGYTGTRYPDFRDQNQSAPGQDPNRHRYKSLG